jgi:hypothetical protein
VSNSRVRQRGHRVNSRSKSVDPFQLFDAWREILAEQTKHITKEAEFQDWVTHHLAYLYAHETGMDRFRRARKASRSRRKGRAA